jgi:hypothetical protein
MGKRKEVVCVVIVNTEYFLQKKERKGISKEQIKKRKTKKKM